MSFPSPHYFVLYWKWSCAPFFMCSRRCEFHAGSQPCSFPSPPSKDHVAITGGNVPISHLLPTYMAQARNSGFPPKQVFPKDGTRQRPKGVSQSKLWSKHQVHALGFVYMTQPRREIPQGQSMSFVSSFIPKLVLLICSARNSPLPRIYPHSPIFFFVA